MSFPLLSSFTTVNSFFGYWQISMTDQCREKATFVCRFETFKYEVMPSGLKNALSTFQQMMNELLEKLSFVKVYLSDCEVLLGTLTEHIGDIENVATGVARHYLKLKLSK